jgi:hypothetical protein
MANTRPTAELSFDVADELGRIDKHGFGFDWTFPADRQQRPSERRSFSPLWKLDGCEIVPGLDLLGLQGTALPEDQSLDDWSFPVGTSGRYGNWRLERPDSNPSVTWLSYTRSEPNERGVAVRGAPETAPRYCVHLIDFVPPPSQTLEVSTIIELRGVGEEDAISYRLKIPHQSAAAKWPTLSYAEGAIDDSTTWTQVDRMERVAAMSAGLETRPRRRSVWIESTDGCLVIMYGDLKEPWIYRPDAFAIPTAGLVAVEFEGHAGMANLAQIVYPETGTAEPYRSASRPTFIDAAAGTYKWSESFYSNGTVGVEESIGGGPETWFTRPIITLTRGDSVNDRPLVSVVHEVRDATLSAPRSDPKTTQTQATAMVAADKDPAELQSLTWRRTWRRGWTFSANLRDPHGIWAAYLKPNMPVDITAGWAGLKTAIMKGYIERPKAVKQATREQGITPTWRISGRDFIGARMQGKKYMLWPCSPLSDGPPSRVNGRWYLDEWAQWWLTRCGFGGTFTCPADYEVRAIDDQGVKELAWDFDQETEVHKGLDAVFRSMGLSPLSVDTSGNLYTEEDAIYSSADFTLDESTATGDDLINRVKAEVEDDDFRNFIVALAKDGTAHVAFDEDSIADETDDFFIADVWMEILSADDARDPEVQAAVRLTQAMRTKRLFKWTRDLKTDLPPGSWVDVTVPNVGVPANTIYRVIQDQGNQQAGNMNAKSTFWLELKYEVAS